MLFKKVNTLTTILYFLLCLGKYLILSAPVENITSSILVQNISNDHDVNDYSRETFELTNEDMMDEEDSTIPAMNLGESIVSESQNSPGKPQHSMI